MPNMIMERKRGSSQTMTFLVGAKFYYHCFCLANVSLLCELESTLHVCIYNAMLLTFLTFVYNVALEVAVEKNCSKLENLKIL